MLKFLFKRLPPNRFPHFSSRSPYNENEFEAPQLEYLKNLHSFSYADLLLEIKKYPGKPETRTKYKILKFISSALPKKDGIPIIPKKTYKSEKEENNPSDSIPENPPLIEPNIEQLKNKINVEEEKAKINQELSNEYYIRDEDYDMEIPLSNQSLYENELLEGPLRDFISNLYSHAKNPQETTPFFENYSPNQILAESCKLSEANLRSELKALHTRSNLFQAPLTDSRMRMVRRSEIKRIFYEMVNLEGEFQKKTTDHLTTLMIEIKQNNVSRQTVQKFIRNLSNPLHCLNDISFFKGAPSNVLSLTWETITSFVHSPLRQDLLVLLNAIYNLKSQINFQLSNELDIFEKMSFQLVENVAKDPETYNLFDLANILSIFRVSKLNSNINIENNLGILSERFFTLYHNCIFSQPQTENRSVSLNVLGKKQASSSEILQLLHGINIYKTQVKKGLKTIEIEQINQDIKEKIIESGLRFFDKIYVLKVLSLLMSYNIQITENIAIEIQNNPKAFVQLSNHEIYLYIEALKDSGTDFHAISQILYQAFLHNIESLTSTIEFKTLLMIAKIQNFFLIRRVFEQRKNINSKKLSTLLSIIENTLENIDLKDKVNDLFLLSSYFNPYLNIPNFLFKKIIENKSYILINKDNKKLIAQFVNDLLIKIKPNYTLFSFANSLEVDFADKITSETIQIFAILLKKFKELNLLSLNLLSINILNSEKILSQCFDNSLERKEYCEFLSQQIVFACQRISNLSINNIEAFAQFLHRNSDELFHNSKLLATEELILYLSNNLLKNHQKFNSLLPFFYYILSSLKQPLQPENESLLNKVTELIVESTLKKLEGNASKALSQLFIYDKSVIQSFPNNVKSSYFENMIFLMPILRLLDYKISDDLKRILLIQIQRDCSNWNGQLMVESLLLIDKNQMEGWEVFEKCIENLSTLLIYHCLQQKFVVNSQMIEDEKVIELLKAYSNQYERYLSKNESLQKKKTINKIPLSILLFKVFEKMNFSDIIKIFSILGKNEENYFGGILDKYQKLSFKKVSSYEILKFQAHLPVFLNNIQFEKKLIVALQIITIDNPPISFFEILQIFSVKRIWKHNLFEPVLSSLSKIPNFLPQYLSYFCNCALSFQALDFLLTLPIESLSPLSQRHLLLSLQVLEFRQTSEPLTFHQYIKETPMSPLLSCLSEKKDALINAVLTGRDFLFKKEISLQEGAQPVEVYYHQSMEFTPKLQEKNWKVLPYLSSFDVSKEDSAVKAKEFSYSEERELFDWTVFTEISQKYILYKLFEKKLGLNIDKNCSLVVNLKKGQEKYLNYLRGHDLYGTFLVEFSILCNQMSQISYKTNYICKKTEILIDLAFIQERIGFIFFDASQNVRVLLDDNLIENNPDNFTVLKAGFLEKVGGWKIHLISFREWMKKYETKQKRVEFLSKCLNLNMNME